MKIKPRLPAVLQEAWSDGLLSFLLQKASGSFFVKVSGAALGFGGEIVLARLTSLSEYGIYIYVWTWISLLAIPATLGFRGALVQLVSKYREKEDWPRLRGILRRSNQFTILAAVGIGALVAFGSLRFPELWENPKTSAMMALGMVALPFAALTINQRGALQGFKQVIWADVPYLILRRILLIGGAAGVWLWLGELTAQEIILALAAALFVAYAVAQYGVWKQIPTAVRDEPLVFEGAKWMYTAIPFLLLSGANLVQNKADILMIGPLVGVEQAGIYGAATRLTMLIAFGLNAANMIVAPMISEYYSAGKRKQMQQLIAIGSAGVFVYTLVAGSVLIALGPWMLSLFGGDFTAGYTALIILVAGNVVNALAGPVGYVMTMTGNQWTASKAFGIGMVLNIALNASLVPYFGMTGAACATALSNASWNAILLYAARKHLGINTTALAIFQKNQASSK